MSMRCCCMTLGSRASGCGANRVELLFPDRQARHPLVRSPRHDAGNAAAARKVRRTSRSAVIGSGAWNEHEDKRCHIERMRIACASHCASMLASDAMSLTPRHAGACRWPDRCRRSGQRAPRAARRFRMRAGPRAHIENPVRACERKSDPSSGSAIGPMTGSQCSQIRVRPCRSTRQQGRRKDRSPASRRPLRDLSSSGPVQDGQRSISQRRQRLHRAPSESAVRQASRRSWTMRPRACRMRSRRRSSGCPATASSARTRGIPCAVLTATTIILLSLR